MTPVLNRPVLEHALRSAVGRGITQFRICLHDQPEQIEEYFGEGSAFGAHIRYSLQPKPSGGVATLKRIWRELSEIILVLPTNAIHDVNIADFLAFHSKSGARITAAMRWMAANHTEEESGQYQILGVYAIESELIREFNGSAGTTIAELFRHISTGAESVNKSHWSAFYEHHGIWLPVTNFAEWQLTSDKICAQCGIEIDPTAVLPKDVRASIKGPVFIGRNAVISDNVRLIGPAVIGNNAVIGRGTKIEHSIVFNNTLVGDELDLNGNAVAGPLLINMAEELGIWIDEPELIKIREQSSAGVKIVDFLFDFAGRAAALCAVILLSPLFLVIALLIKLTSRGPIFYVSHRSASPEIAISSQKLVRHRPARYVRFRVFRTMVQDADKMKHVLDAKNLYDGGPFRKLEDDPRVTPIGRFLRKTSLDELPLLFSVVTGNLKLVGLWALPVYEAEELARNKWGAGNVDLSEVGILRFEGEPGIAGLWQSRGRSNLTAEERAIHDSYQALVISRSRESHPMKFFGENKLSAWDVFKHRTAIIWDTARAVLARTGAK
ncbi:MAG: sugar transferase [Candidatus Sumerlaeota bacterium]|nr:sugar transferase [Candidatus Sumerlaeota bacterium]